ncbi:NRDE family protein [Psychrobacter sanguinis]|uniref:NRDE family protein n=1 Tax=Psychrobacter sanguinis TaxID=861445 RepID=UPI00191A0BA7|nr:NRDE family protein [Psychrobacter sanguinis]MCC3345633.1 NRDE family protein [Psychrobacter sanguinis]
MCIAAIAWQLFDEMPLVLLSNRDEFLQRPTTPAHQWVDMPIYAGRDDQSGGTWLGIHQQTLSSDNVQSENVFSQNGRWAAVLNFRDGVQAAPNQRSRGELVTNFLTSDLSPLAYARQVNLQAYAGFNLIVGDDKQAVIVNNRGYPPTALHSGLHIISNGQPDNAWFKSERLRSRVRQEVLPLISESLAFHNGDKDYWLPAAWEVLTDTQQAPDEQLPDTGVPPALEQALSSICIDTSELPNYGTRTQSILTLNKLANSNNKTAEPLSKLTLQSREYLIKHS